MKLSSLFITFALLATCSANIFGGPWNYFFPKRGSASDYANFKRFGKCYNCNLADFDLRPIIEEYKGKKIDLEKSDCTGANLSNVDLSEANLNYTVLDHTNLKSSKLKNATLHFASLDHANLENTDLKGADFELAFCYGTNLQKANIKNTNFYRTYLDEANLKGATVNEKTSFADTLRCESVDFRNIINLDKVNFKGANLKNCKTGQTFLYKIRTQVAPIFGWFARQ